MSDEPSDAQRDVDSDFLRPDPLDVNRIVSEAEEEDEVEGLGDPSRTHAGSGARVEPARVRAMSLDDLMAHLSAQGASVATGRHALDVWLASRAAPSRRLRRARHSPSHIWRLLHPGLVQITPVIERALSMVAHSSRTNRPTLHPSSARAALILSRRVPGTAPSIDALLQTRALPDEPSWLFDLTRHAMRSGGELWLQQIAASQLEARYWNVAALIAATVLVTRYAASPRHGALDARIEHACDAAALQHAHEAQPWIEIMADAALGGQLDYAWLELPVEAAIRLAVDRPERANALRAHHAQRPYDAGYKRLWRLYAPHIQIAQRFQSPDHERETKRDQAASLLLREADRLLPRINSTRAQRLVEMALVKRWAAKPGPLSKRIARALDGVWQADPIDPELERIIATLASLYVYHYDISPERVEFVRRWAATLSPEASIPMVTRAEIDLYLDVGDYDRAIAHLTCKYDGVSLDHADKAAAARIKYFVQKRARPGSVHRALHHATAPLDWLGHSLGEWGMIEQAIAKGLDAFEAHALTHDLRETVIEALGEQGAEVDHFDQIATLSVEQVEGALATRRRQRLMLGALAGGLSGGLAPLSWGLISLADIPIILGLSAEICARFCWYYGFDPREHKELPLEILAVALGGSRPDAIEPMLLRQNLREFALKKSLVLGAIAKGGGAAIAGRALREALEAQLSPQLVQRIGHVARETAAKNFQQRAAAAAPSRSVPLVGALLGATLNVALLYDLCEAAQAVLTDRFLERKYPDWIRHFDMRRTGEVVVRGEVLPRGEQE